LADAIAPEGGQARLLPALSFLRSLNLSLDAAHRSANFRERTNELTAWSTEQMMRAIDSLARRLERLVAGAGDPGNSTQRVHEAK
jgi:hypothetical protein